MDNNGNRFQTGNILLISLTHFVHDVYSSFLAPILPLLIEKIGMSYTLAGFLTVVQRLPSLLNPIIGLAADKVSVKYLVIFSPSVTVIVMSLLGIAPSYGYLLILLFIMGISASGFHVPAPVIIRQISGKRIGKGMSFFMFGGELARSIGPLVILGGVSIWTLEGTYKLIPFGLIASIFLFFKFRKIEFKSASVQIKSKNVFKTFKNHLPLFSLIFGISFFITIAKGTISTFLTVYLTESGTDLWFAGISLSIFQLAGAAGTFFAGTISDKIGRKKILVISSSLIPILLFLFIILPKVVSIITLVLLGFFLFAFTPVMLAMVNEKESELPTFINGVFMTINFLTSAITISLVGLSADYFSLDTTYYLSAFLCIGAIPFVLKIKN